MADLRDYQNEILCIIRKKITEKHRKILIVLGCGGGKSVIAAEIVKGGGIKNNDTLFVVHRKELCQQIEKTFMNWGADKDFYKIGMVQTLARRGIQKPPKILIVDECHHIMSSQYKKILKMCPEAILIGFTATPQRLDKQNIMDIFTAKIEGPSVDWLIQNGYLADYNAYNAPLIDTSELEVDSRLKDFRAEDITKLFNSNKFIFGNAVQEWQKKANNKKTIVYCHSIEVSKQITLAYKDAGILAEHLDGTTPKKTREQVVADFRDGKITVLSNVDLFGEGFDVPDCECVQLLRPTASYTVFVQQIMRPLRPNGDKVAILLDHTANIMKFGTPRLLQPPKISKKKLVADNLHIKTCPQCYTIIEGDYLTCPKCGYEFDKQETETGKKYVHADLELIVENKRIIPAYDDIICLEDCKSWEDLEKYRKQCGYKFGWMFYKARDMKIPIPNKYYGYMKKVGFI